MQKIAEVSGRNWLDSWPRSMQEDAEGKMDIIEAYIVMTRMWEDEEMDEVNINNDSQDSRCLPPEDESEVTYITPQQAKAYVVKVRQLLIL